MPCGQPLQDPYAPPANPGAEGREDLHGGTTADSNSDLGFLQLRPSGPPLAARRPSVAPSAWSLGGFWKDCDHADDAPTACLVVWRGAPGRCTAGVARSAVVRGAPRCLWVDPAQLRTRHAPVSGVSACSGAVAVSTGFLATGEGSMTHQISPVVLTQFSHFPVVN